MKRHGITLAVVSLLGLFVPSLVSADVNDFIITKFASEQTLTNDDPQGTLRIVEEIDVVFTDNNHGIIRAIPKSYKGNSLQFRLNNVSSKSGAPTDVQVTSQNGNALLRIGHPDKTVTGAQNYTIDYTLKNVVSFYGDHDELYWDVNGDQWGQPLTNVSVTLHLPSGVTISSKESQCFAGVFGATGQSCSIAAEGSTLNSSAQNLLPFQTLTYVVGFEKGYFKPVTGLEKVQDNIGWLIGLVVLPQLALFTGFFWWWRKGRDAPGRGVIVPQYEPLEGVGPLESGMLARFSFANKDITAMLIDLACRGYVRIHETTIDRKILKDKVTYELELLRADTTKLTKHETDLITTLFLQKTAGEKIDLSSPNTAMQTFGPKLKKAVEKDLKKAGYFTQNPFKISLKAVLVAFVLIVAAIVIGNKADQMPAIFIGIAISTAILFIFALFLPARTTKGVAAKEYLEGLKLYMNTAEKDRIEKLQSPKAAYASNADEPKRTVELFEKLLPYAVLLGVEKQWAEQFASLYSTPPSWYSGNMSHFNSVYLANSLNTGFASSINANFNPPSSSGGSGFSGGSSGGGGGGGGGGGW